MFHHVAVLRFAEGTTQHQVAALDAGLEALSRTVAVLAGYRFGRDVGMIQGTWDYGIVADFADRSGYEVYRDHPDHVALIHDLSGPITAEIARVQFET